MVAARTAAADNSAPTESVSVPSDDTVVNDVVEPAASEPTTPEPKRNRNWLIAAAAIALVVVVIGAVVAFANSGRSPNVSSNTTPTTAATSMPNVVGKQLVPAKAQLVAAHFRVTSTQKANAAAPGVVLSQHREGDTIELVVSAGPSAISIPNVAGQSPLAASAALEAAGFKVATTTVSTSSGTIAAGEVVTTAPAGAATKGTTITLVVSSGSGSTGGGGVASGPIRRGGGVASGPTGSGNGGVKQTPATQAPTQPTNPPPTSFAPPTHTTIVFTGNTNNPTITITGPGFGSEPSGTSDQQNTCGNYPGNGDTYGDSGFYLKTPYFAAGSTGACTGIVIEQWSQYKIVFKFGTSYNSYDHWYISNGDSYTIAINGVLHSGTVAFS